MPLLTLVAPITTVVPLVVCLDYVGSASQGLKNRREIAWRELFWVWPFMAIGIGVGLYLLKNVSTDYLAKALGVFVIAYAIYQYITLPTFKASRIAATYCGFFGGMVGALFNAGGPFYIIYLTLRQLERTAFRATYATNYLIDGGIRLAAYLAAGLVNGDMLNYLGGALPIAVIGLWLGGRVHGKLPQAVFVRFISALLVASGALLLSR